MDTHLTWLHLSDLHFKVDADWQRDVVLQALMRDVIGNLPGTELAPDAVFVTGDIAHSGKDEEYKQAGIFLNTMAKKLDLDPALSWFLVPGNHDVDRTKISSIDRFSRQIFKNPEATNELLSETKTWGELAIRQAGFFRFTQHFLGPQRSWNAEQPWRTDFLTTGPLEVAVLCLNSAWLSQDDDDERSLLLSEYQVRNALAGALDAHLRFALFHHPLSWLRDFDRKKVFGILTSPSGCHFMLRGHLHETDLRLRITPGAPTVELAAGACWQGAGWPHSVIIGQLDFSKRMMAFHVWRYSDKEGGFWARDVMLSRNMPEGVWQSEFPKQWSFGFNTALDASETSLDSTLKVPEKLVEACAQKRLVLFSGYGLSMEAGLPKWDVLLLDMAKETEAILANKKMEKTNQGPPNTLLDTLYHERLGRGFLGEFFETHIRKTDHRPSKVHRLLARIPFSGVISTTFDELLEKSFQVTSRHRFPTDASELMTSLAHNDFFFLKAWSSPDRRDAIYTIEEFRDLVREKPSFKILMQDIFLSRSLLFVGCDPEALGLMLNALDIQGAGPFPHYFLIPTGPAGTPPSTELLWHRFGIDPLIYRERKGTASLRRFCIELTERSEQTDVLMDPATPYLQKTVLENIGPHERLELNFDPCWNVIIGDNGTGKTHVLKAIAAQLCREAIFFEEKRLIQQGKEVATIRLHSTQRIETTRLELKNGQVSATYKPLLSSFQTLGGLVLGFPPFRGIPGVQGDQNRVTQRPVTTDMLPLLGEIDPRMSHLEGWIVRMDHLIKDKKSKGESASREEQVIDRLFSILNDLSEGVTLEFAGVNPVTEQILVNTEDGQIPLVQVSQGMSCLIALIGTLVQRLYEVYGNLDQPVLVLVDEIDAHMHPKWQQVLPRRLQKAFPNAQFIVTTHSPLIVAGLPEDQVHRLLRDKNGRVVHLRDLAEGTTLGKTDQVLTSILFGLDSARDQITAELMKAYRRLLRKSPRTPDEEDTFQDLAAQLRARSLPPAETMLEAHAQELLDILLQEQIPELYPDAGEQALRKIKQIFQEIQVRVLQS
ncbi:MAG: AAA family ATPase [Acidobacteriota bacterium]|nr:AAA family ATPase [Acidobacteriota bacterium]